MRHLGKVEIAGSNPAQGFHQLHYPVDSSCGRRSPEQEMPSSADHNTLTKKKEQRKKNERKKEQNNNAMVF